MAGGLEAPESRVAPTLVVIRGNSGSGKSSTAREVRRRYGRGCALVEQDYLRRVLLREHGDGGVAPGFIVGTVRAALDAGYHVVLEGILDGDAHRDVLRKLIDEHSGTTAVYYFDVPFEETVRRHLGRAESTKVTAEHMRDWYVAHDLLGVTGEHVLGPEVGFEDAVTTILHTSGLGAATALTPCPTRCPRCAA